MNITPLHDKVVIQPSTPSSEVKTESGLYVNANIPESASNKQGTVVAVGPGSWNREGNSRTDMSVKEGNQVMYSWGDSIEHEGMTYDVVSESNIIAIVG